jgi:hypothetical protein
MATIQRFANCEIAIYVDGHMPPRFHIEGRGFRVLVEIDTVKVRAGDIHKASQAMAWAAENQTFLRAEWVRLNQRT